MIRLLILDVEGVLTPPAGGHLPWALDDLRVIRDLLSASPAPCVLCTGRQAPYGEALIQALALFRPLADETRKRVRERAGLDLLAWPSILENGCYFYDPLSRRPIAHPALDGDHRELLAALRRSVVAPLVERTGAQVEAGKDYCVSLNPPPLPNGSDRAPIEPFYREVCEAAASYSDAVEVKHSLSSVDITPRGVSKASAVSLLLDWTGLAPDEVAGVGDTRADEEWLRVVGCRAAPANGREALPGLDYYSPDEVTRGLIDILERLKAGRLTAA